MENIQTFSFPRLNEPAPAFNVKTTFGDRTLEDYKGKWLILFSHPVYSLRCIRFIKSLFFLGETLER